MVPDNVLQFTSIQCTTPHCRWVNHEVGYTHPEDRSIHTNRIESVWIQIKVGIKFCPNKISYFIIFILL